MSKPLHLLVATPGFEDPFFEKTVSLLLDHSPEGAMGVVLNRSLSVSAHDILEQAYLDEKDPDGLWADDLKKIPVYWGGPMESTRAFVLHNQASVAENDTEVAPGWFISSTLLALEQHCMHKGEAHSHVQLILGYAGWSEGQLEDELKEDVWLELPIKAQLLEISRATLWEDILAKHGISMANWVLPHSDKVH
jgi:putative transcriptional regulator